MIDIHDLHDVEYFLDRAASERIAAADAKSTSARAVHHQLAQQYSARAARLSAQVKVSR